jgi:regulator of protease activity HflC (stomatin/prohibitin superfamily)
MINPLPTILFTLLAVIGYAILRPAVDAPVALGMFAGWLLVSAYLSAFFRISAQWEKALVFRLGKFHAVKGPGVFTIIPLFDNVRLIDTRIVTLDIPTQQAITKDNVPISIDGVIFLRVENPRDAVIQVQNFQYAIRQYAQTALRDVIGAVTLDEILADRETVGKRIEAMVEEEVDGWGLEVAGIRIQDIILPEDLKRVMSRQAAAEREKRANITKSEGDREAAENLAAAAAEMATSPGALQLRTLQTLDSLGASASNTVVLAVPVDVMHALQAIPKLAESVTGKRSKGESEPYVIQPGFEASRTATEQGDEGQQQTT